MNSSSLSTSNAPACIGSLPSSCEAPEPAACCGADGTVPQARCGSGAVGGASDINISGCSRPAPLAAILGRFGSPPPNSVNAIASVEGQCRPDAIEEEGEALERSGKCHRVATEGPNAGACEAFSQNLAISMKLESDPVHASNQTEDPQAEGPPSWWELRFSNESISQGWKSSREPRGRKRTSSQIRRADGDWWRDANLLLRKLHGRRRCQKRRISVAAKGTQAVVQDRAQCKLKALADTADTHHDSVKHHRLKTGFKPSGRTRISVLGDGQLAGWSARVVLFLGRTPDAARALACTGTRIALMLLQDVQQLCAELRPNVRALLGPSPWGEQEKVSFDRASSLATILSVLLPLRNILQLSTPVGRAGNCSRPCAIAQAKHAAFYQLAASGVRPSGTLQEVSFELEQVRVLRVCHALEGLAQVTET